MSPPVSFIPISQVLQHSPVQKSEGHAQPPSRISLQRSYSSPMLSLPPEHNEWADVSSQNSRKWVMSQADAPHAPHPSDVVLVSTLLLEHKITNLEERLKTSMGPWALYGLRYSIMVGIAAAATTKIAMVAMGSLITVAPLVGLGLFLGLVVGSIIVGMLIQTITRHKFKKSGQSDKFSQEIITLKDELLQTDKLSGTQIKSLRRLQIMAAEVEGGFKHSVWSIFYGITGFDPQLARMMRNASDAVSPKGRLNGSGAA